MDLNDKIYWDEKIDGKYDTKFLVFYDVIGYQENEITKYSGRACYGHLFRFNTYQIKSIIFKLRHTVVSYKYIRYVINFYKYLGYKVIVHPEEMTGYIKKETVTPVEVFIKYNTLLEKKWLATFSRYCFEGDFVAVLKTAMFLEKSCKLNRVLSLYLAHRYNDITNEEHSIVVGNILIKDKEQLIDVLKSNNLSRLYTYHMLTDVYKDYSEIDDTLKPKKIKEKYENIFN